MKKFFVTILVFTFAIVFNACSSQPKQARQPRQPIQQKQTNYDVNLSDTTTQVNQNSISGSASLGAESMKVWSIPLEIGFYVPDNVGVHGHIDEVFPKDEDDILRSTEIETYYKRVLSPNVKGHSQTDSVISGQNINFNELPPLAQSAVLAIIKDYNLDGFYITMIEEFTGSIKTKESTGRTIPVYEIRDGKKVQTDTKPELREVTKTYKQVRVRGLALKIKVTGPVDTTRSDEIRKQEAGAPKTYIYR